MVFLYLNLENINNEVSMKKIVLFTLILATLTFSQIITYSQTYNLVYVKKPAKSKQIVCKTRVNLSKGLVDNYACPVNYIIVRDKNNFKVGELNSIPAYGDDTYADYDIGGRYDGDGKKIYVDYEIPTVNASWEVSDFVSCPNNYIKTIEDYYFTCIKKATCKSNERYNAEDNECVTLDSGYVWLNKDKNDLSQRPACKAENERYNENTNQCDYKIENSRWIGKSLEYECNEGYVMIDGLCEEKVSCNEDERYNDENNSCVSKPENSHWNQDNDIIWTCDNGYVERYGSCEVKKVCNEKQKYVETDNLCENPPYNGSWDYKGDVVCDEGYVKVGLMCEQKADCEHWNSEDNTCFEKPIHSHWVYSEGDTWECDNGYHSDTENEYCFKCEGETQFNYSTNTCVTKPENSHWSGEGIWHCNEGFFETEYSCEEIKECGFFERYNSYTNECVDKPSDSHWTYDNSTDWECDDGYYKTYYDKCEKTNPIDLINYISFAHDLTFGIGAGSGKDQKDNSTTIFNVEANYNIGVKIGNEFFNVRPQFSAGLLYTEFEYSGYIYMDETVNSMAFTFGPNIGFDFWKFSFDYSYIWRCGERLESITFNDTYSKYKFGFNINEHFNVNVTMISKMISSTQRLKEFDDNMFSLGLTYRF